MSTFNLPLQARYKYEGLGYVVLFGLILFWVLPNIRVIILLLVAFGVAAYIYGQVKEKKIKMKIEEIASEMGLEIEHVDSNGKITANISKEKSEGIIADLKKKAEYNGIRINVEKSENINNVKRIKKESVNSMSVNRIDKGTTQKGFVNNNLQRNNGRTEHRGTDHGQWFYDMECLKCGHKYYANGSDIWRRKCPNCQGGKP